METVAGVLRGMILGLGFCTSLYAIYIVITGLV